MWKKRLGVLLVLAFGALVGLFVYNTEIKNPDSKYAFSLGLDLSGGSHLVYRADVSEIDESEVKGAMASLREVVETRINQFGVAETNVQVQEANFANNRENRLIVDIPGITDVEQAKAIIGKTPTLEFKTERPEGPEKERLLGEIVKIQEMITNGEPVDFSTIEDPYFIESGLTGRYLKRANVDFQQSGAGSPTSVGTPVITLEFNKEGAELFEKITTENIGKVVAIYLDGQLKTAPVVQTVISDGQAIITGNFTPEEAREIARDLNFGALPLPIESVSTQSIGPSLGAEAAEAGVFAGLMGFIILSALLIFWYRVPGLVSVISLIIYTALMFAVMKLMPITVTAAGIAGFIISLGLAVDGNILIAERMKEEMNGGRTVSDAIRAGFDRAWTSIRDSNTSSILTAVILFWFGSSLVQGFALTLGVGAILSMFSAVSISRLILMSFNVRDSRFTKFIFKSGVTK